MPERSRPALLARRAIAWSLGWGFAAALYLLLIDITDLPELIVGAGAAVLAATGMELAREQGLVGEGVRARRLLRCYRLLVRVPVDVGIVSAMALVGLVRRAPGLAEAVGSVAPNTFVVGIDGERGLILAHQLKSSPDRKTIDPLELG
jgi:hypothetical protein